jgi:hypothetical protein
VAIYSDYGRHEVPFVRRGTIDEPPAVTRDLHKLKVSW